MVEFSLKMHRQKLQEHNLVFYSGTNANTNSNKSLMRALTEYVR